VLVSVFADMQPKDLHEGNYE